MPLFINFSLNPFSKKKKKKSLTQKKKKKSLNA